MKVIVREDCGNAPRKEILRALLIAIVEKDTQTILDFVAEDVRYVEIGKRELQGLDYFLERIEEVFDEEVRELELFHFITHGKQASVNGRLDFLNRKEYHFSIIFEFKSAGKHALLKEITNYIISV